MKKALLSSFTIVIAVIISVVFTNSRQFQGKQQGSRIGLDDRTKFELVTQQEGKFVTVESGMSYSLPRLWRDEIENLEGKEISIRGTRHLAYDLNRMNLPMYIDGQKVIDCQTTGKGMTLRLVTTRDVYLYQGTVLIICDGKSLNIYSIYRPHRYV